jgi:hypothetical protein
MAPNVKMGLIWADLARCGELGGWGICYDY